MKRTASHRLAMTLGLPLVAGLTLLSGVIHGRMSHRWGAPCNVLPVAERLRQIPKEIGPWQAQGEGTVGEAVQSVLQCIAYVDRTYVNRDTGAAVHAVIFLGPPGPISVHRADVCFPNAGYAVREQRDRAKLQVGESASDVFWAGTFQSTDLRAETLRVYYGWSTGGPWTAPDDARFKFAGRPYLYKMQLTSSDAGPADSGQDDPCRKFLEDFVPVVRRYLVDPAND